MGYAGAFAAVLAATLVNWWARTHFDLADQAMLYLLAVLLVASRLPRGPSMFAAAASVAALDFFFVAPHFTFIVDDTRHLITFGVMLVVGLIVSGLTLRIRQQARAASERERRSTALYEMSRELAVTSSVDALAEVALHRVRELFSMEATVLLGPNLDPIASTESEPIPRAAIALAECAIEVGHPVGADFEHAPSTDFLAAPMLGTRGAIGAFVFRLTRTLPSPVQVRALEAFVAQTAPAIERGIVAREAEKAHLAAETERTRNTLLAGVSHDLRTPLASIGGSASILLDPTAVIDAKTRTELLEAIRDEAGRLARLVNGLLELARLESGGLAVHKQWCPLEEVLASAVGHLEQTLADRPLRTRLGNEGELLLVPVDPVLLEQVFINLLDNAAKYSPPGSPIEIRAWIEQGELHLEIADEGHGLAPGEELRIFEKFYRAEDGQRAPGAGVGLAVCEAIVKAHGGRIEARRTAASGAIFAIGLPIGGSRSGEALSPASARSAPRLPIEGGAP